MKFKKPLHVGFPNMGNRDTFLRLTNEMLDRGWFTNNGELVQRFEKRVSEYLDVKHCVAICNGTVALEIAIRALGLKGEVIVPSYTFIATAHAVYWQDITPVFADIDPVTHNLDPESVRQMITPRTTGIIGVHLWGRGAPHVELQAIADQYELKLAYDAAHAFGCTLNGKMIGGFGECEVFSFHATKFFNTFEGGAIVTNNDEIAEAARLMRNFGFQCMDDVIHPGTNGKMTEICAAMGLTNFEQIDKVIESNRLNYYAYQNALAGLPGISLLPYPESEKNNFQYVSLEVARACPVSRDALVDALRDENVLARKYFWPGCHKMKPYRDMFPHAGLALPNTKHVAEGVIVLPTGMSLPDNAINVIASIIRAKIKEAG